MALLSDELDSETLEEAEWGGVFAMNPQKTFLSDEEYLEIIGLISERLFGSSLED